MNLIKKLSRNIFGSRTLHLSGGKSLQIILICGIVLIGTVSYLSQNSFHISKAHVDEVHTTGFMLKRLHGNNNFALRVPESGRILGFLFHPIALYYMNTKMGGEVYLKNWHYSRDYLKRNIVLKKGNFTQKIKDPNIQDYVFALRAQQVFLLMASFLFAGISLLSHSGLAGSVVYLTAGLASSLIYKNAQYFYNDIQLAIAFNIIVGLLYCLKLSWFKRVGYLTVAFAFGATTKMSMAIFAPLVWYKIFKEISGHEKKFTHELTALSFVSSIGFYFLLSIGAHDWVLLVHEQLSNVWHYGTGHRVTQLDGIYQIKRVFSTVPDLTWYYFFWAVLFAVLNPRVFNWNLIILLGTALAALLALASAHYFVSRNVILFELLIILLSSIVIGQALKTYNFRRSFAGAAAVLILVLFAGYNVNRAETFNISSFEKLADSCASTLSIGKEHLSKSDVDRFTIEAPFRMKNKDKIWREKVSNYDCVYVSRSGQYKQFSNFILPDTHKLKTRHGNHFFYRK